jgi:hypothetical protein
VPCSCTIPAQCRARWRLCEDANCVTGGPFCPGFSPAPTRAGGGLAPPQGPHPPVRLPRRAFHPHQLAPRGSNARLGARAGWFELPLSLTPHPWGPSASKGSDGLWAARSLRSRPSISYRTFSPARDMHRPGDTKGCPREVECGALRTITRRRG